MHDTFLLPNALLFLIIWLLSTALLYYIIKVAVRNGVEQATSQLTASAWEIEKAVIELKMEITKKESN